MNGVIMSGSVGEFDVPSILQAVSLSRQCTLLRLWDHEKRQTGEIRVKAGQLLGASCGQQRGRTALHALLRTQHHSFRVERFADPVNLPAPVGPLAALLLELPTAVPPPVPEPPLRLSTPAQTVETTGETTDAPMPEAAAQHLSALAALAAVVVCGSADEGQWCEWRRGAALPGVDLRALIRMVLGAETKPTRTMVEVSDAIVVVQPAGEHAIAAYAFAGSTPLGLVRMVVDAAHDVAAQGLLEAAPR